MNYPFKKHFCIVSVCYQCLAVQSNYRMVRKVAASHVVAFKLFF